MIKKLPFLLLLVLVLSSVLNITKAESVQEPENKGIIITPFTGYRYDIYQFSIPLGTSSTDRILSKLTWKNHISETGVKVETLPISNEFNILGVIKYGHI